MTVTTGIDGAAPTVETAIRRASQRTGIDFGYLMKTAMRESSLNPSAKAPTSSASGLFQFIESTWLETVKRSGPEHGLQKYADQIRKTEDGDYAAVSPKARQDILALRFDPVTAANMAGAFTQKNADTLSSRLGRSVHQGELYIAHFMGANGAVDLISRAEQSPEANAARVFPKQARANKAIFYNRDGSARTMSEVYSALTSKHSESTVQVALASQAGSGAEPIRNDEVLPQPFLDMLGFFRTNEAAAGPASSEAGLLFDGLYRGGQLSGSSTAETDPDVGPQDGAAFLFGAFQVPKALERADLRVAEASKPGAIIAANPVADQLVTEWMEGASLGEPSRPLDLLKAREAYRSAVR